MRRTQILFTISFCAQNTNTFYYYFLCAEHKYFLLLFSVCGTQILFTIIFCVQNTNTLYYYFLRHVVCAEHRQFSPSCCVRRTQIILTVTLCLQNTDKQNTDNSHRLVVSTENRQFSPSCVCRTQTNSTQTILTVTCVQNTNGTQTILTVMLCVQNTDKQNADNCHCHFVCAEHRQTEHRQLSLSCCECRTRTNRTQTILTVILCVQNTVGR